MPIRKILFVILLIVGMQGLFAEDQPLDLDFTNAPVSSIIQTAISR